MSTMRKEQCNNDERIPENLRTRLPGLAGHNRRIHFRIMRQATDPAEGAVSGAGVRDRQSGEGEWKTDAKGEDARFPPTRKEHAPF